ncbi:MAG: DNA mismatch repair endonuclease MutL [Rhizobiaceae bacterium]|nr:DNA mismatch repair endonuclease MutL [Rhizobiaceae bacterium]
MANTAKQTSNPANSVFRLNETVVNQIAAGEVIERPASVIKELVENAIDAGADRIEVTTANGGKTLMRVSDNGHGMSSEDLAMSVERHCTSKLSDDLMDIRSLGFRGEALPSIGSVSRLSITSRRAEDPNAWKISVHGGRVEGPTPAALTAGTVVEVTDLFYATPARLKFLKSDQAETNAITDVFKRMSLAFPSVRFAISGADRATLEYPATDLNKRLEQVLGKSFRENSIEIDAEREGIHLTGLASVPTFHRGNALAQYFFVNGRPVRDKALLGAVRGAYMDHLPSGRHPTLALFLDLDPYLVDVNVHPAKADVRFRDPGLVRGLIVGALKQALSNQGPLTSQAGADAMMDAFRTEAQSSWRARETQSGFSDWARPLEQENPTHFPSGMSEGQATYRQDFQPSGQVSENLYNDEPNESYPLGSARAQVHKNYIVSQTEKGLIIVDQHAAHERIVYEKLKAGMQDGLAGQLLLVPEIIDLPEEDVNRLVSHSEAFDKLGLELEAFGPGAIAVRATPAMLGETNVQQLIQDLADEIAEWGSADGLQEKLEHVAATMACHGSVRSGRILKAPEMNELLRQMENTPNSGQCNHGRPTFIELDLKDIERLFGR